MPYRAVALLPWGSFTSDVDPPQEITADLDLGSPNPFIAFLSLGYIGGRVGPGSTTGPWDFDNAVASEIYAVDSNVLTYIEGWWSRFGPPNAFTNYHSASYQGFGRIITFRMRIWQPSEMEAITDGIVLFNI
jgi:hypothetical protein